MDEKFEFSFIILGHGWWLQQLKFLNEINKSIFEDFYVKKELINQMNKLKDCNFAEYYYSTFSGGRILINNIVHIPYTEVYFVNRSDISEDAWVHFWNGHHWLINFCALFFYDLLNKPTGYYENWFEDLKKHKTQNSWNKVLSDFLEKANVEYINENENLYFMKYKKICIEERNMIFTRSRIDIDSPEEVDNGLCPQHSIDDFSYENMLGIINVLFSTVLFSTEKFLKISEINDSNGDLNEKLKFFSHNINKEFAKDAKNTKFIYPATTNYLQPNSPYNFPYNSLYGYNDEYNKRIVFLHGKLVNNGNFPFIKDTENIKANYKKYTDKIERLGKGNTNEKTFNLYIYGLSSINEDYLIKEVVDRKCWKNIYISFSKEEDKDGWERSLNEVNPSLLERTKFIESKEWWIEDKDGKVFSKF